MGSRGFGDTISPWARHPLSNHEEILSWNDSETPNSQTYRHVVMSMNGTSDEASRLSRTSEVDWECPAAEFDKAPLAVPLHRSQREAWHLWVKGARVRGQDEERVRGFSGWFLVLKSYMREARHE